MSFIVKPLLHNKSYALLDFIGFNTVININTGYINGTDLAHSFKTKNGNMKEIYNWMNKKSFVDVHASILKYLKNSKELVNEDVYYKTDEYDSTLAPSKQMGQAGNISLAHSKDGNVIYDETLKHKQTLDRIKGSYLHPLMIVKLLEWCDKSNIEKNSLFVSKYAKHMNINTLMPNTEALESSLNNIMPKNSETLETFNGKHVTTSIKFNGIEFKIISINDDIWFNGLEIARFCGYKKPKALIQSKKYSSYKQSYENLYNLIKVESTEVGQNNGPPKHKKSEVGENIPPTKNKKTITKKLNHPLGEYPTYNKGKVIFINYQGVTNMISGSHKDELIPFQQYIGNVMNKVRLNKTCLGVDVLTPHTHYIQFDYGKTKSDFNGKYWLYICYIGVINNEHIYKCGRATDIYDRLTSHKNTYKDFDNFVMMYVIQAKNERELERVFLDDLKHINMSREHEISGSNRTEHFTTNEQYTITYMQELMAKLVDNHVPLQIEDKSSNNEELKIKQDHEYRMKQEETLQIKIQEETKQMELKIKQMELELKLK